MATPSAEARCAFCGDKIQPTKKGGGRPKDYCGPKCRSRAHQQREREPETARPPRDSWQVIVNDLTTRARRLDLVGSGRLAVVAELTEAMGHDVACLTAVAVDEARHEGWTWAQIAAQVGVPEASARAHWGGSRGAARGAGRIPAQAPSLDPLHDPPPIGRAAGHHPLAIPGASAEVRALGCALYALHQRSGTGLDRIAAVTDLPPSTLSRLLDGTLLLSWSEVYMVAHALGGEPLDLRLLWECAWGQPSVVDPRNGTGRLAAALRGARLAAGFPGVAASCPPGVDPAELRMALHGQTALDWPVLRDVVVGWGADPRRFKPLWKAARIERHTLREGVRRP
ncbi:hypothetical protein AAHZ94_19030 [Streptomyces sp. HSW2009]|uniref:hypothetical protein n=1 Tax=Streptomyces sp. HSW2009 TaxID=3142890 RepID=UPI0032F018BE